MSSSTCWAESLKPIGMPPVAARTSSANGARSRPTSSESGKRAGRTAGVPGLQSAHLGDLGRDLAARKVAAGAGLGALPPLEVERLAARAPCPGRSRSGRTPARRSSGRSRPARSSAACPPSPEQMPVPASSAPRARRSWPRSRQRPEAHVARRTAGSRGASGACAFGPIDDARCRPGSSSSSGIRRELGGQHLEVVPRGQPVARHAHRDRRTVRPGALEPSRARRWMSPMYGSSATPCAVSA